MIHSATQSRPAESYTSAMQTKHYISEANGTVHPRLTSTQKGAMAEAAVTTAAAELGLTVSRPMCEGRRYDLILDLEPRLLRVQCKLARSVEGALLIPIQTSRYTPQGYVCTGYSADEVDAIAAYAPASRRCYMLPIAEVTNHRAVHLRLSPTKNNQAQGIRWACDYEFGASLHRYWDFDPVERAVRARRVLSAVH